MPVTKPSNLKITDAHFKTLARAINKVVTSHPSRANWGGTMKGWISFYKARGLSDMRARWDLLWVATLSTLPPKFVIDKLYPYLNDDRIDSALKSIVSQLVQDGKLKGAAEMNPRRRKKGKTKRNPSQDGIDYTIKPTHISQVRTGDIILHHGKLQILSERHIKRGFMGRTIFGDSYRLGKDLVDVVVIKKAMPKRNPPRKCRICGKPVVLSPSAADRAKKYGGTAEDYYAMFPDHAECVIAKRSAESKDLMRRLTKSNPAKSKIKAPRPRNWEKMTATYFLNHGPDASHFSYDIKRFLKLSDAKNAAAALGHNKWVIIRAMDAGYKGGERSVVAAGNAAYRNKAQAYVERLNEFNAADPTPRRNPSRGYPQIMHPDFQGAINHAEFLVDMGEDITKSIKEAGKKFHLEPEDIRLWLSMEYQGLEHLNPRRRKTSCRSKRPGPTPRRNPARPKASYYIDPLPVHILGIGELQFALVEMWQGHLKAPNYERTMTALVKEMEKRTGMRYGRVKDLEPVEQWHASLTGAERLALRRRLQAASRSVKKMMAVKSNPATKHRRGSLTHARSQAKAILDRSPIGTLVMVGQWLDTGEYEAKAGGGMSWGHERFMPVEQWTTTLGKSERLKKVSMPVKMGR